MRKLLIILSSRNFNKLKFRPHHKGAGLRYAALLPILILVLFLPNLALADGGIFPHPYYPVYETGQKAVIFYEKGEETLILSTTFKGEAKDFGWVIPTPSKPEVEKGSDEIFTSLAEITQPIYQDYYAPLGVGFGLKEAAQTVTVIETKKIDYYEISVLSATDSGALARWLLEHGYQYPQSKAYILNDYINNNWYFVAVKISPEAQGDQEVAQGLKEGHATPLKLVFQAERPVYPLKISSIEPEEIAEIKISDNLVFDQNKINALRDIGYPELTNKKTAEEIIDQIIKEMINNTPYINSKASQYSLIVSPEDYEEAMRTIQGIASLSPLIIFKGEVSESWETLQNLTVEKQKYQYLKTVIIPRWFNAYFVREGIKEKKVIPRQNYIGINLYVITAHKKEIPGFSTYYGNWIKAKTIKELAFDPNGKPLIEPQGKKYFLTHLYRSMQPQEMKEDLFLRDAPNNKKVNVGPTGWNKFSKGLLAFAITLLVWLLSPVGLLFIIFSLVQFLTKSRKAHRVSLVFQALYIGLVIVGIIFYFSSSFIRYELIHYSSQFYGSLIGTIVVLAGMIVILIIQDRFHKKQKSGAGKNILLHQN